MSRGRYEPKAGDVPRARGRRDPDRPPSHERYFYIYLCIKREIYHDLMCRGRYKPKAGDLPSERDT